MQHKMIILPSACEKGPARIETPLIFCDLRFGHFSQQAVCNIVVSYILPFVRKFRGHVVLIVRNTLGRFYLIEVNHEQCLKKIYQMLSTWSE